MRPHLVAVPTSEPVSLAAAKKRLRVQGDEENDEITDWIKSARQHAERITGRQIMPATWELWLDAFPIEGCAIRLPRPPLLSVTSITYTDTAGVSRTWRSSLYIVDAPGGPTALPGLIVPAFGQVYPGMRPMLRAAIVRFQAGYDVVPEDLIAAIYVGVGELYLNRERPDLGKAMNRLLWPFKVWN